MLLRLVYKLSALPSLVTIHKILNDVFMTLMTLPHDRGCSMAKCPLETDIRDPRDAARASGWFGRWERPVIW